MKPVLLKRSFGCGVYCLLFISSKLPRCARRALRCSPRSPAQALREPGSHWTSHACMEVMPCVCCKPVAEGGAGIGLRLLRGARKRNIIRYGDQEGRRSSPVLPLMRGRGGRPLPLTHETRCLAGGGWGGSVWSLVLVGERGTRCRRALPFYGLVNKVASRTRSRTPPVPPAAAAPVLRALLVSCFFCCRKKRTSDLHSRPPVCRSHTHTHLPTVQLITFSPTQLSADTTASCHSATAASVPRAGNHGARCFGCRAQRHHTVGFEAADPAGLLPASG
jgi:hypothetical protein